MFIKRQIVLFKGSDVRKQLNTSIVLFNGTDVRKQIINII